MKNAFKYISGMALLAAAAASCDVSDTRETYTPDTDGVSFVQSVITATALSPDVTTYSVDLARGRADNELTVNLTCSIYNSSDTGQSENLADVFGVPSSVTFAPGEYQTEITFNVGQMEVGESFSGTIAIAEGQECFDPNTAISSVNISLAKDYSWINLGQGQWFDQFMLMSATSANIQSVEVRKADGYGNYRVYKVFPEKVINETWDGDMVPANSSSVPEYIQFTIDEAGAVSWGNTTFNTSSGTVSAVSTGYNSATYGGFYYFPPSALDLDGDSQNLLIENGTLVQICWTPYCPDEGIWWGSTSLAYLALPDFQGDLGEYLGL